jgi:hypothetical protein
MNQNLWTWPDHTINEYASLKNKQHLIAIQPAAFEKCWPDCVVLITVEFLKDFDSKIKYLYENILVLGKHSYQ